MENYLQNINRDIIALPEDEVKRNNRILEEVVLKKIVPELQRINKLYKFLYRNIQYAGSFFCGLKVGHPDEYDLDFLMELPEYLNPTLTLSNIPGYVQIQLKGLKQLAEEPKNHQFMSNLNVTETEQTTAVPKRKPAANQQKIEKVKQWGKGPKDHRFTPSINNVTRTENTVVPKRKPTPYHQQIRVRSQKMQKLWDTIRYNPDLPLTKEQRIALSGLANLLDDNYYLDTTKVSAWIEGILEKTINGFRKIGKFTCVKTSDGTFKATLTKSGPAFTLKLRGKCNRKPVKIDIDLVPGFVFSSGQWPPRPFRQNPIPEKPEFFIVPKKPNKDGEFARYWRPSFQEQERVLMNDLQNFKPALRLLKRLRDVCNHQSIVSYHLKTIFLWELERNRDLWDKPLEEVFMTMLGRCKEIFESGRIFNYWYKKDNLIKGVSQSTLDNIANNFKGIIADIERNPHRVTWYLYGKSCKTNNQ